MQSSIRASSNKDVLAGAQARLPVRMPGGRRLSRAGLERLIDETQALRWERDKLQERNHALKHPTERGRRGFNASGESGAPDGAPGQDPPAELERTGDMLRDMDGRLEACVAAAVFAADPNLAQEEVLRAIRSRAALVTLHCIGLMLRCACAVLPSMLMRVHVAALRPREVGGSDSAVDAVAPAICREYAKSLPLRIGLVVLWVLGQTCGLLALFDRFEPGSAQEWIACLAVAMCLASNICVAASFNAKTVRTLLKEFETLYVVAYALGMTSIYLFLFRERPAKMVAFALGTPSLLLSGFQDASAEGSRVLNSRVFFMLNVVGLLTLLALVSLNLGTYADFTFHVGTFSFAASLMVCSTIATLLVFGVKNIALSFYEPGSLVTFVSAVCCVHTDADALAVLKGSYSVLGQSFGKYKPNETAKKYLKRQRKSIIDFCQAASVQRLAVNVVVPAVAEEPETDQKGDDVSGPSPCTPFVPEGMGLHAWPLHSANEEGSAAGSISRRAPVEMQARPHPTRPRGTRFYFPHG
jgi:hypothetical protein